MALKTFGGHILNVDLELLRFEVDGVDDIFYAGKWVIFHHCLFPKPDQMITINLCTDTTYDHKVIVLCEKCEVDFDKAEKLPNDHLLFSLLQNYTLGIRCYFKIHELYEQLNVFLKDIVNNVNVGRIIIGIVEEELRNYIETKVDDFKTLFVKPLSHLKNVESYIENHQHRESFWTYDIHQKLPNSGYVLGYLIIGSYGIPILCDTKWWIPVKIFQDKNIREFINRFVLIKKASMITEAYNLEETDPTSCLLLDVNDIIPLKCVPKLCQETINVVDERVTMTYTTTFTLLHIGPICKGPYEQEQCWLRGQSDQLGNIFIVLEGPLINVRSLISINEDYTIFHDEQRTITFWNEVQRLEGDLDAYVFKDPSTKFFSHESSKGDQPKLLNVNEAIAMLGCSKQLINITGLIVDKTFCTSNYSFYGGRRHEQPFGTPGNKTHKIHLRGSNGDLTIFLNDFNRYLAPFGLVPNMIVNAYNVVSQRSKYYKCTALTTFELVKRKDES